MQARATEHGKTGKTGKGKPELSSQEENEGDEKGEHKDKDKATETQRKKYTDTKKKTKLQRHRAKEGYKQKYQTVLFARGWSRQPIAASDISIYICLIDIRSKSISEANPKNN